MLSTGSWIGDSILHTIVAITILGGLFVGALIVTGWRIPQQNTVGVRVEIGTAAIETVFDRIRNVPSHGTWLPHISQAR